MSSLNFETTGVMIVDHGSRRQESNEMLLDVVALFKSGETCICCYIVQKFISICCFEKQKIANPQWKFVEPAHMELVPELSIAASFRKLVDKGFRICFFFSNSIRFDLTFIYIYIYI